LQFGAYVPQSGVSYRVTWLNSMHGVTGFGSRGISACCILKERRLRWQYATLSKAFPITLTCPVLSCWAGHKTAPHLPDPCAFPSWPPPFSTPTFLSPKLPEPYTAPTFFVLCCIQPASFRMTGFWDGSCCESRTAAELLECLTLTLACCPRQPTSHMRCLSR
jgi:hypothetical protein